MDSTSLKQKGRVHHFLISYLVETAYVKGSSARSWVKAMLTPSDWDEVAINRASLDRCGNISCPNPSPKRRSLAHLAILIEQDNPLDRDLIDSLCSAQCCSDFLAVRAGLTAASPQLRRLPTDLVALYMQTYSSNKYSCTEEIQDKRTDDSSSVETRSAHRSRAESNLQLQPTKSILASKPPHEKVKKSISFASNTRLPEEEEEELSLRVQELRPDEEEEEMKKVMKLQRGDDMTKLQRGDDMQRVPEDNKLEYFKSPEELYNDLEDTDDQFSSSSLEDLELDCKFSVTQEVRQAALSAKFMKVTRLISSWSSEGTRSYLLNDFPPRSEISTAADSEEEDADFYDPMLAGQMAPEHLPRQTIWRQQLLDQLTSIPIPPQISTVFDDVRILLSTFRFTQAATTLTAEESGLILGCLILLLYSNDWACLEDLSMERMNARRVAVATRLVRIDEKILWATVPSLVKTTIPDALKRWQLASDIVFDDD